MTLAIEDIRNSARKSGFDHVGYNVGIGQPRPPKPYQAVVYGGKRSKAGMQWIGPRRATAEEAAQDYCDYVSGDPATPASLKLAGHVYVVDETDTDEEYQAALGVLRDRRAQRQGKPGWVYLIIEVQPGGALIYGKIGYSTNPKKRVAELQTGNPRLLKLHALKSGTEEDERDLHAKYIELNRLQEWFWLGHRRGKDLLLEFDLNEHGDPWGAKEADAA